jgi:uncharacterized protein
MERRFMKIFYHDDMDGVCSAFWVRLNVGIHSKGNSHSFKAIPINYNQKFPLEEIDKDEQIWIVDYSIEPSEMVLLLERTKDVTWIDHHKTAIEKYKDFPQEIRGVRKDGEAGCILTFKYIHWWTSRGDGPINLNTEALDNPIPEFTKLIGDRDIWKFQYGDRTKYFYLGCQLYDWNDLDSPLWNMPFVYGEEGIERIISEGRISERYRDNYSKRYLKSYSFEVEFEGHSCLAMNMGLASSEYFLDNDKKYAVLMPFVFNGVKWTISLYTTNKEIDVSEIAKKYGGGGHKGAAGFVCDTLPFKRKGGD